MSTVDITISVPAAAAQALSSSAVRYAMTVEGYLNRAVLRILLHDEYLCHQAWLAQLAAQWDSEAVLDEAERLIGREIASGQLSCPEEIQSRVAELLVPTVPAVAARDIVAGPSPRHRGDIGLANLLDG